MKSYTFKNGNIVIKHNFNGRTVFSVLFCNENDEQVAAVENLPTYAQAAALALEGQK